MGTGGTPSMATKIAAMLLLLLLHNPSSASPIQTIVVLVMENRSFDHMLGWMKRINPEINGVDGSEWNAVSTTDPNSKRIFFNNESHYVEPNPGHSFREICEQVFGSTNTTADPAPMNGFAQQAYSVDKTAYMSQSVMNGFLPDKVAVYKTLVSEFAVFDRWFASLPTETQPNRLYVHSATSHGTISNNKEELAKGYPQRTIFQSLDDDGISWRVYYQQFPNVLFYRNMRKLKYAFRFHSYHRFKKDARKGNLPGYAVVEPRYFDLKTGPANDDHPSHDVYQGQMLVKDVYETLRASPQWNQTLFLITYDEHGGFYDHVPPPARGVPNPDGIVGPEPFFFKFDRLGVRVPTIAISPWIEKGTVVHGPNGSPTPTSEYEHSSIAATVKKLYNLSSPFLTQRDAWAGTFEAIVQKRTEPRTDCPEILPTPLRLREGEPKEEAKLTEFQQEIVQLAAVLKGENTLTSYPENIATEMNVKQGKEYVDNAVTSFFQAGRLAKRMGVDEEQIVQMRPSLTTRSSKSSSNSP